MSSILPDLDSGFHARWDFLPVIVREPYKDAKFRLTVSPSLSASCELCSILSCSWANFCRYVTNPTDPLSVYK